MVLVSIEMKMLWLSEMNKCALRSYDKQVWD
jgi:hypothetical protein